MLSPAHDIIEPTRVCGGPRVFTAYDRVRLISNVFVSNSVTEL